MENKIFKNNINSLIKYNIFATKFLEEINFLKIDNIYEEEIHGKSKVVYFCNNGNKYLLHSKVDPEAEAEQLIKNIDFNKDSIIIVFGLGLGYHLFKLKSKISKETRVIIVEPNIDVLKYSLTQVDLSGIFDDRRFFVIFGDERQTGLLALCQTGNNFYNMAYNTQILMLPNYHVYYEQNKIVMQQIIKSFTSKLISYGNALDDMLTGFINNYLNVDAFMESNSIDEIRDKYKGVPAIVVASGPSLDKNIDKLKNAYGKALIISCDASLRACEKNGVKPDAIASIERDEPTYTFYYKGRTFDKDIVLLGPGVLWQNIYEEFPGKKIVMAKRDDGIEQWWYNFFENPKFLHQGQSCATVAFAVAEAAGCNPIILIGQDLAFTEGKKHSDSTHTEHEGENDDREADGVYVKDYDGNLLKSDYVYKLFKEWFESKILINSELEVIDATEGGAYIEGTKIMTLEEAINKYCVKPIEKHLVENLKDVIVLEEEKNKKYMQILLDLDKQIKKIERIAKMSHSHFKILIEIESEYEFSKCTMKQLQSIIVKMQKGDQVIQKILNMKEYESIKTFYQQIITQTIIFVKKIGNELTPDNLQRNFELQKNLMYIIENSSNLIIKEYEKAKKFLEDKQNKLKINLEE